MVQAISEGLGMVQTFVDVGADQLQAARYGCRGMEPEESLSGDQGASSIKFTCSSHAHIAFELYSKYKCELHVEESTHCKPSHCKTYIHCL